jgi:hypothetical protein
MRQVANRNFDTSSRWTTEYYGSTLLKLVWVDFVFHWVRAVRACPLNLSVHSFEALVLYTFQACAGLGCVLWWRRLVLKGFFLFIYFLGSLGCFVLRTL